MSARNVVANYSSQNTISNVPNTASFVNLDRPTEITLLSDMLEFARVNLKDLLGHNYRNRSKVLKKIMYMLIDELETFRHPESYTIKELFSHLLVTELGKMKYYTWGQWLVGPRSVCCRQTYILIKIMFSRYESSTDDFLESEDFECLREHLHSVGLALLQYYWQHDFVKEIAIVKALQAQDACKVQLPFKDNLYLATITKKGYVGMFNGNIYARQFVLALNQCFMENIVIDGNRPYRKDSGKDVVFEDFQAYTILKRDGELLHVLYTELLELYKQISLRQREAYKQGQLVVFDTKKLLRKMSKNSTAYDLFSKLRQLNDMFYSIKITDPVTNGMYITKILPVACYDNHIIKINASTLMKIIEEIEGPVETFSGKKSRRGSAHTFYLPVGGKKGGQHAKVIVEHVIALLCQAGRPYGQQPKKINFNLWELIQQYPQIITSYDDYEATSRRNVWLKRLVEGVYKRLDEHVAPRFINFTIIPELKNNNQKTVNVPTTTTIARHVITITHKGWCN